MPSYLRVVRFFLWAFLTAATSTAAEASKCITNDRPLPGENNLWYRSCDTDTALLFLHGLASDSLAAWLGDADHYWPSLVRSDDRFEGTSIFLGGYHTARSCDAYDIPSAAREIYNALTDDSRETDIYDQSFLDRTNIIIVAHSMGGLIARYMLYHYREAFKNKRIGLLLVASPSNGSEIASIVNGLIGCPDDSAISQLALNGGFIDNLDRDFRRLLRDRLVPVLVGRELLETSRIWIPRLTLFPPSTGEWILVVSPGSGARYFGGGIRIPDVNHVNVAKPNDRSHPTYKEFYTFHREFIRAVERARGERERELGEAISLLSDAGEAFKAGQLQKAARAIEAAEVICERSQDFRCFGDLAYTRAQAERIYGSPQEFLRYLTDAGKHYSDADYRVGEAEVQKAFSEHQLSLGHYELATRYATEAIDLYLGESGRRAWSGSAQANVILGEARLGEGRKNEARAAFQEALERFEAEPSGGWGARAGIGLATILFEEGEHVNADKTLGEAKRYCQEGNWECVANVVLATGNLQCQSDRKGEGLQNVMYARRMFEQLQRLIQIGDTYMVEGEVCASSKEQSRDSFKKAVEIFRRAENVELVIEARDKLERLQ